MCGEGQPNMLGALGIILKAINKAPSGKGDGDVEIERDRDNGAD